MSSNRQIDRLFMEQPPHHRRRSIIDTIEAIARMQARADEWRRGGRRIALVPTMGFLHAGHLSLVRLARGMADKVVVSIFVNPTQFGPGEDLDAYPRDLERDRRLLAAEGVDALFLPSAAEMYPEGYQTRVTLDRLPRHLCGVSRPVHFGGVATVVAKLMHIAKPHLAVFGEKDYQQLLVVRRMVRDLNLDVEIVGAPTVREADGLAMSSRNAYLGEGQRPAALTLSRALDHARRQVAAGERQAAAVIAAAETIIRSEAEAIIDYVKICDPETLEDVSVIDRPVRMALAVKVGRSRLIDNMALVPPNSPRSVQGETP
jgi:pantoate--beta-alanine ligase